ncbi:Hap43p-repressed protein [Candida albicans P75010]|nr:Hap43p-repressed protein [Candida albicans P75010]
MTIVTTDVDLFQEISNLPSEITAIIIGYLPKCILPQLLYFQPIQKEVAFIILLYVNITERKRHKGSETPHVGYSECDCNRFKIELNNLKKGIAQWNVYPRAIHMDDKFVFRDVLDTFPRLLKETSSINGTLSQCEGIKAEALLNLFFNTNLRFASMQLNGLWDPATLPSVATSIRLFNTTLNSYVIPGVKKLDMEMYSNTRESQTYTFSPDLEDLRIDFNFRLQLTLPPNLRKLTIRTSLHSAYFISDEMVKLEYLQLELPQIESFEETGIVAPNLKTLILTNCAKLSDFRNLEQFQNLKYFFLTNCGYPFGLFKEDSFPMLERFEYDGNGFIDPENFKTPLLTFPPNLNELSIKCRDFINIDLSTLMLPPTLTRLTLLDLSFNDGYFHLGENLQYVHIETYTLRFDSSFKIPHLAGELILEADYLSFESPEFMYHLPNSLTRLYLIGNKQGEMSPIKQKIKWPLVLGDFVFENFNIDYHTLKLMNLNESRLEKISICGGGGGIKKLDVDLFPISVKGLALVEMRIHELPASFKRLNNLRQLSLMGNQLRNVNSVRLPVSSLEVLNVRQCNLRLISPFLVSMLEEKNQNANLRVEATGNLNVNINDVRRVMKAIKGLSLELNRLNDSILKISNHSYRLEAVYRDFDPYFETPQSSETEEVVSDYDSDDLYNGSVFYSDEEYSDDEDDDNKRKKN